MSDGSNLKHPVVVAPLSAIITVATFMGYGAVNGHDEKTMATQMATVIAHSASVDKTLTDIKSENEQRRIEDLQYRKEQREDMKLFQAQQREQIDRFIMLAQETRNDVNLNTARIAHITGGMKEMKDGIEKIEDRIENYFTNTSTTTISD